MILQKRIPKEFYKLFRTQNMQYYMMFLVALFEENTKAYMALGLTEIECRSIIGDVIAKSSIKWAIELEESEVDVKETNGTGIGMRETKIETSSLETEGQDTQFVGGTPAGILSRLVSWGWLKKDFDEKINRYVYSFPEYSQLYIELFQHLQSEDDSRERESILSVYSLLYTFLEDREKNNDILRNAVLMCRRLSQLLTNMQDGIRSYFEELSKQKNFIGIQEVLIDELNNSDSRKYAILTTTDSFYRYKEEIKEILNDILVENDRYKNHLIQEKKLQIEGTLEYMRMVHRLERCEQTGSLAYRLEREFDLMEQKYKKLIEQKSVFAKRALARMHYILQEGNNKEDYLMQWIQLLNQSENKDEILEQVRDNMKFTSQFKLMSDRSFSSRKIQGDVEFKPEVIQKQIPDSEKNLGEYVPKPLYTKRELREFKVLNMENGKFVTTKDTVQSMEDLEKLLLLWQEATENMKESKIVELGNEISNEHGMIFSKLTIMED